jgi:hypothetical protein
MLKDETKKINQLKKHKKKKKQSKSISQTHELSHKIKITL